MKQLLNSILPILIILLCIPIGRAIFPLIAPFVLSFAIAFAMEPAVSSLARRGVRRHIGAGIMTTITFFLIAGLLTTCTTCGAHMLTTYAKKAPSLLAEFSQMLFTIKQQLELLLNKAPVPMTRELSSAAEGISSQLEELPLWASQQVLHSLSTFAKQSPNCVLFLCTAVIGIYFFSAYFTDILDFVRRQIPERWQNKLSLIWSVTVGAGFAYLKVQCIISGITFLILLVSFMFIGIDHAFYTAAIIAIVDALPILGSGTVLIPWAVVCLLLDNAKRAVALLLVYALLVVSHNILQTKLIGTQLGLHPVASLVSLYIGWKLWGLCGMIFLPILCVLLCRLNRAGIIHLYK